MARARAARAAGREHDHDGAVRRHHEAGRRPRRVDRDRPLRDQSLLSVRFPHRLGVEAVTACELPQDRGDLLLHLLVEDELAPRESPNDLGRQVVGGRAEPAGGDDQRHPLGRQEAQRRLEVVRAIPDRDDVGDVHPLLLETLGDPRPVAVGDPTGQHLGARDDDSAPNAHGHSLPV